MTNLRKKNHIVYLYSLRKTKEAAVSDTVESTNDLFLPESILSQCISIELEEVAARIAQKIRVN